MDRNLVADAIEFTSRYIPGDFVNNPVTIQEKLAHIKIFGVTDIMTVCADKLRVKEYVKRKTGEDLCVPLIEAYRSPDEIDPDRLPDRFVLKCNHGCAYNIIVHDKMKFDVEKARGRLKTWLAQDFSRVGYELQYRGIPRRCFSEQYVESIDERIKDYKFLCFNGEPKFVKVEIRSGAHDIRINCYDLDFRLTDIENKIYPNDPNERIEPPKGYEDMLRHARTLCRNFDFVRVDFMQSKDRIYLGEMTFTPGNARMQYRKPETALMLGNMLRLS